MPGYTTLSLLGAQQERFEAGCLVIESRSAELKRHAQQSQARWHAEPTLERQREYALDLKAWATETRNGKALAHARKLLEVTG